MSVLRPAPVTPIVVNVVVPSTGLIDISLPGGWGGDRILSINFVNGASPVSTAFIGIVGDVSGAVAWNPNATFSLTVSGIRAIRVTGTAAVTCTLIIIPQLLAEPESTAPEAITSFEGLGG